MRDEDQAGRGGSPPSARAIVRLVHWSIHWSTHWSIGPLVEHPFRAPHFYMSLFSLCIYTSLFLHIAVAGIEAVSVWVFTLATSSAVCFISSLSQLLTRTHHVYTFTSVTRLKMSKCVTVPSAEKDGVD